MSDSVQPHRWQHTRLPRPWDSPGKNTGVGCHFLLQCMKGKSESEIAQSCPTLSDPMDCSVPGSSPRGILQARVLEWGAIAFPWIRKWQLLQYSCLENTMGQKSLEATVHGVARLGHDWMTKSPLYLKIGKFVLGKSPCHFSQLYLSSRTNLCRNVLWVEFSPPTTSNLSLKHSLISLFDTIESIFIPYQRTFLFLK